MSSTGRHFMGCRHPRLHFIGCIGVGGSGAVAFLTHTLLGPLIFQVTLVRPTLYKSLGQWASGEEKRQLRNICYSRPSLRLGALGASQPFGDLSLHQW